MATILLVDDDPLQAFLRKSILERRFPHVRRVGDAASALCLVEQPQFAASLGLVVSGRHQSGIGGPAFVAELHTRMPFLPVLVLGDIDEIPANYIYVGDQIRFLSQPILAEDILSTADRMLTQDRRKTA
jgi:DNA-binding NtrC family response regulator